ncbi:MAG: hypothetical protein D6808_03485 [Candidatus Dadabacteria bacterium]|nr:MAG: hypothetical protein D6808_03485 [Candidatus Dadabacteria bacterium]
MKGIKKLFLPAIFSFFLIPIYKVYSQEVLISGRDASRLVRYERLAQKYVLKTTKTLQKAGTKGEKTDARIEKVVNKKIKKNYLKYLSSTRPTKKQKRASRIIKASQKASAIIGKFNTNAEGKSYLNNIICKVTSYIRRGRTALDNLYQKVTSLLNTGVTETQIAEIVDQNAIIEANNTLMQYEQNLPPPTEQCSKTAPGAYENVLAFLNLDPIETRQVTLPSGTAVTVADILAEVSPCAENADNC